VRMRTRQSEEPEINITSLVDVVFLLLIFFMVTTSFVHMSNIHIQLPKASSQPQPQDNGHLVVTVDRKGRYYVDGHQLVNTREDTLRRALRKVAGAERDQPLTVRADARTTHQSVVTVLDAAGALGFHNIVIETANSGANGGS